MVWSLFLPSGTFCCTLLKPAAPCPPNRGLYSCALGSKPCVQAGACLLCGVVSVHGARQALCSVAVLSVRRAMQRQRPPCVTASFCCRRPQRGASAPCISPGVLFVWLGVEAPDAGIPLLAYWQLVCVHHCPPVRASGLVAALPQGHSGPPSAGSGTMCSALRCLGGAGCAKQAVVVCSAKRCAPHQPDGWHNCCHLLEPTVFLGPGSSRHALASALVPWPKGLSVGQQAPVRVCCSSDRPEAALMAAMA